MKPEYYLKTLEHKEAEDNTEMAKYVNIAKLLHGVHLSNSEKDKEKLRLVKTLIDCMLHRRRWD